jgi:hypothetical protein
MSSGAVLLTKAELLERVEARGCACSIRQLDRARHHGLIRVAHSTPIPGGGSVSWYSEAMADNLVAIRTLIDQGYDYERIGPELWSRGYDVADAHWEPLFIVATRRIRFLARASLLLLDRRDADDQFADRWTTGPLEKSRMPGPLRRPFLNVERSLPDNPAWSVVWAIVEAMAGERDYNPSRSEPSGDDAMHRTFLALAGAKKSTSDRVVGQRFEAREALPDFLKALALLAQTPSHRQLLAPENQDKLLAARDDVRYALSACENFHRAVRWFYGNDAFGLRCAAWLAGNATPQIRAHLIVGWMAIRDHPMFPTSLEIEQLAIVTEALRQMSQELRDEIDADPRLKAAFPPARVKAAFSRPGGPEQLRQEMEQIRRS